MDGGDKYCYLETAYKLVGNPCNEKEKEKKSWEGEAALSFCNCVCAKKFLAFMLGQVFVTVQILLKFGSYMFPMCFIFFYFVLHYHPNS